MFKPKRGGELTKVGDLFLKYTQNLIAPEASVIVAFIEVVDDVLSINIPKSNVRYNPDTKTLSVTRGGPLKSEIKLREAEIVNHLKARLGPKNAPKTIL